MQLTESFDEVSRTPVWECDLLPHNLDVISNNRIIGRFEAVLKFKIIGANVDYLSPRQPQPQPTTVKAALSPRVIEQEEEKKYSTSPGSGGASSSVR